MRIPRSALVTLTTAIIVTIGTATLVPTGAAAREPGKPAVTATGSGTGCFVRDANGVTYKDPNCVFHRQVQIGPDREVLDFQYRDHGQLPAGATFPKTTIRITHVAVCDCPPGTPLTEVITPSGEYRSTCHFKAGDEPVYWPEGAPLPPGRGS